MLAYRTTWIVKQGKMQDTLEAVSAEIEHTNTEGHQFRVYTPDISPSVLVFEMTSESAEAHDQFWADYRQNPRAAAFWEKWYALTERELGTERWDLAEWR